MLAVMTIQDKPKVLGQTVGAIQVGMTTGKVQIGIVRAGKVHSGKLQTHSPHK